MQELVATVLKETRRFDNPTYTTVILSAVGTAGSTVTLKGPHDELGPDENGTYRFYGKWSNYFNKYSGREEKQFHYSSCIPHEPKGETAIVKYLCRCPSISLGIAEQIWNKFGEESIVRLAEGDPLLLSINRLTDERIQQAIEWLDEEATIRDSLVEVLALLDGRGMPKSIVRDVVKAYGARAAWVIKRNGYALMRFYGCGFRRADKLYLDMGGNPKATKRMVYAAEHAIRGFGGNTWFALGAVNRELRTSIGGADVDYKKAAELGRRSGKFDYVFTDSASGPPSLDGDYCWITTSDRAGAERRVAQRVKELMR